MKKLLSMLALFSAVYSGYVLSAEIRDANGNTITYCSGTFTIAQNSNVGTFVCSGGKTFSNCTRNAQQGVYTCTSEGRPYICSATSEVSFKCQLSNEAISAEDERRMEP